MQMPAKIRTYARIRPLNETDQQTDVPPVVRCISDKGLVFNPSSLKAVAPVVRFSTARGRQHYNQKYEFDSVFAPECLEDDVYEKVARPLLISAINGSNASMFAYGATGCGKSHTISAIQDRISVDIIRHAGECEGEVTLKLTYLQLYNEKIIDLIPKTNTKLQALEIREASGRGHAKVAGLAEHLLHSSDDARQLIARGNHNRVIATTQANSNSSRSHAVLTFHIEIRDPASGAQMQSTLSIIDLAGSERAQTTKNRGERLNEGAKINKSLLALGNCITARAQKRRFIPYRESKLTRLLRFSLEGNCETAMIVCISPAIRHFDETRNSLEYGKRAASISRSSQANAPTQRGLRQTMIKDLEAQIAKLSIWKGEVMNGFMNQLPELKAQVDLRGGPSGISGTEFVNAVASSQMAQDSLAYNSDDTDDDNGGDLQIRQTDAAYTRAHTFSDSFSPLKRSRRNVSALSSHGSMFNSPQTVKRLHV